MKVDKIEKNTTFVTFNETLNEIIINLSNYNNQLNNMDINKNENPKTLIDFKKLKKINCIFEDEII